MPEIRWETIGTTNVEAYICDLLCERAFKCLNYVWKPIEPLRFKNMQTSQNSVRCGFNIVKKFGCGICECAKENGSC